MLTTHISHIVRRRILLEWITAPTRVHTRKRKCPPRHPTSENSLLLSRHNAGTQSARPSPTIVRAVGPLQHLWQAVKERALGVPVGPRR